MWACGWVGGCAYTRPLPPPPPPVPPSRSPPPLFRSHHVGLALQLQPAPRPRVDRQLLPAERHALAQLQRGAKHLGLPLDELRAWGGWRVASACVLSTHTQLTRTLTCTVLAASTSSRSSCPCVPRRAGGRVCVGERVRRRALACAPPSSPPPPPLHTHTRLRSRLGGGSRPAGLHPPSPPSPRRGRSRAGGSVCVLVAAEDWCTLTPLRSRRCCWRKPLALVPRDEAGGGNEQGGVLRLAEKGGARVWVRGAGGGGL